LDRPSIVTAITWAGQIIFEGALCEPLQVYKAAATTTSRHWHRTYAICPCQLFPSSLLPVLLQFSPACDWIAPEVGGRRLGLTEESIRVGCTLLNAT
jgi:hypothetical protein